MAEVGAVVEGYYAARAAHLLAARLNAELPITAAAYRVLYEGADVSQTVTQLLCREKRAETEDASWDSTETAAKGCSFRNFQGFSGQAGSTKF